MKKLDPIKTPADEYRQREDKIKAKIEYRKSLYNSAKFFYGEEDFVCPLCAKKLMFDGKSDDDESYVVGYITETLFTHKPKIRFNLRCCSSYAYINFVRNKDGMWSFSKIKYYSFCSGSPW